MTGNRVAPAAWRVFSVSVQGVSHRRTGQPNQDAAATIPTDGAGDRVVLTVADGHGSEAYFRSDVGARIATEVMMELGQEFLSLTDTCSLSALRAAAEEIMPRRLTRLWRERVMVEVSRRPHDLAASLGDHAEDLTRPYGTTLLGAVLTPEFLALWQLGDGDILLVGEDGESVTPLASRGQQLGVDTESLITKNAWREVRVHWSTMYADRTSLVLLATDGLANSYASDEAFQQFGSDVLVRVRGEGFASVRGRLPGWLARAAEHSGDDVTVAGALREATQ